MALVNKFNVNKQEVTLDADIIENMSANDVSYNNSTQYDENTVGDKLSKLGSGVIYDVSAHNNGVVFESLQSLLNSSNLSILIPTSVRHGGMSIRFVQSSNNKYVQCRLMTNKWSINISDWKIEDNSSKYFIETNGAGNRVVELYLEGLDPTKQYYFSSLRNIDNTMGIQIKDDEKSVVVNAELSFDYCNKIVKLYGYHNSGVTGYAIFNITTDDTNIVQPIIDNKAVSSINNSPIIKQMLESTIVLDDIYSSVPTVDYGTIIYLSSDKRLYRYLNAWVGIDEEQYVEYNGESYYYKYRKGLILSSTKKYFNSANITSIPFIKEVYIFGDSVDVTHTYGITTVNTEGTIKYIFLEDNTTSTTVALYSKTTKDGYAVFNERNNSGVEARMIIDWTLIPEGSVTNVNCEFDSSVVIKIEESPYINFLYKYKLDDCLNKYILGEKQSLEILPSDSQQWIAGYYDKNGYLKTDVATAFHYNYQIEIGKLYHIKAYLNTSLSVVALDENYNVVDIIIEPTASEYAVKESFYVNLCAKYIAISLLSSMVNSFIDNTEIIEINSDLVKDVVSPDLDSYILGKKVEFPILAAVSNNWNEGYYDDNGIFQTNVATARYYKYPIQKGYLYKIQAYLNPSLSVVALDENNSVVEIVIQHTSESEYITKDAFYVAKHNGYIAISFLINESKKTEFLTITKIVEIQSGLIHNLSSENISNAITLNSIFSRVSKNPIKMAFFGDSTYDGASTTGWTGHMTWDNNHEGLGKVEYICEKAFPYLLQQKVRMILGNNNFTAYNVGYSGKEAIWGLANFDTIFANAYADSNIIVVGFGINDRLYYKNDIEDLRAGFKSNLISIINKIKNIGKTPMIMTSQAGWQAGSRSNHASKPYNKMTFSYINACVCDEVKKAVAKEMNVELIDLNAFDEVLLTSGDYNPLNLCSDTLHFTDAGHILESDFLTKCIIPRTINAKSGERVSFFNQMVKCDYYIDTQFVDDAEWHKKLSVSGETDLTKEMFNACIFTNDACTMNVVGSNITVTINGVSSNSQVNLDVYKYYFIVVKPASAGDIEMKGILFSSTN